MRFRRSSLVLSFVAGALAIAACVGDDPVVGGAPAGANGDAGGSAVDGATPGQDASSPIPDGGVDAGPPPCGYAGEACCAAPLSPCNDGLNCSPDKVCVVNDMMAVGYVFNFSSFDQDGFSATWDGVQWTNGPAGQPSSIIWGAWSSGPKAYRAVTEKGKVLLYSDAPTRQWLVCGNFGCSDPQTTQQLWAVYGFSSNDFWVAGTNVMFQCNSATCTSKTAGMPGTWGQGNFSGTSSSDLWYSAFDQLLHWNGTTWQATTGLEGYSVWARTTKDVWCGKSQLQHFDGTQWSPKYNIEGNPAPGTIYAVSGSAADDVWAVGYNGSVGAHPAFAAHWNGTEWKLTSLPIGAKEINSVWAVSKVEAFAAAEDGSVYRWNGTAWTTLPGLTLPDGGALGRTWTGITGPAKARPQP